MRLATVLLVTGGLLASTQISAQQVAPVQGDALQTNRMIDTPNLPQKSVASPFTLQGVPQSPDRAPPKLAEHADAVLHEAGLDAAAIAALRRAGAFGPAAHQEQR